MQLLGYVVRKKKKDGSSFVDFANCQCEPHPKAVKVIDRQVMITWDMIDRAGNLDDEALRSATCMHEPIYCGRASAYNHNVLLPNGNVVLCCMDFDMQRVLGNLKRQSYEEICRERHCGRLCGKMAEREMRSAGNVPMRGDGEKSMKRSKRILSIDWNVMVMGLFSRGNH